MSRRLLTREFWKLVMFPGLNLHARQRYRILPSYFLSSPQPGERLFLDAGCGNGMLSYQSCLRGNRVVGISIKEAEVAGCQRLFNGFLGISEDRLSFKIWNLYDVEKLGVEFDEIICSEVLEHLVRDSDVCKSFGKILKPGGVLHLCCPNALHPDHAAKELDSHETGGHVRPGYTLEMYRSLLEPAGFRIGLSRGLGGPVRQAFNRRIIRAEEQVGRMAGLLFFLLSGPFLWLDVPTPRVPYSIYVQALKLP